MSNTNSELKQYYTSQIRHLIGISVKLRETIDSAQTNVKKKVYTKKLIRNNKKCAHIVEKLGTYLEKMGEDV